MFLHVAVPKEKCRVHRCLWRDDSDLTTVLEFFSTTGTCSEQKDLRPMRTTDFGKEKIPQS